MNGLRLETAGAIARIVLARPEVGNAIDLPMAESLAEAAIQCDENDAIRCVVLAAEGRMFCVGGDIASFAAAGDGAPAHLKRITASLHVAVARLARMGKPLVTVVHGPAAGAGMSLALLGDIVLAGTSAHFTTAYGRIGLSPDGAMSWLLPRLVGLRRAQDLLFTNRRVLPDEALALGMVTRVEADERLAEAGAEMARELAHGPTPAMAMARQLLLDAYGSAPETQMEREARGIADAVRHDHGRAGIEAFLAKETAVFA